MRIVIDTNIWVSGLLWRGLPWELLRLADAGQVEICTAPPMLNELERVSVGLRASSTSFEPVGIAYNRFDDLRIEFGVYI